MGHPKHHPYCCPSAPSSDELAAGGASAAGCEGAVGAVASAGAGSTAAGAESAGGAAFVTFLLPLPFFFATFFACLPPAFGGSALRYLVRTHWPSLIFAHLPRTSTCSCVPPRTLR